MITQGAGICPSTVWALISLMNESVTLASDEWSGELCQNLARHSSVNPSALRGNDGIRFWCNACHSE